MKYLRNTWYVAAFDNELSAEEMLARRLLDEPIILFRDVDGRAKALADICPHRMAPLSKGSLSGGVIACGYHGLQFDGLGTCVSSPFGNPPRGAVVRSYPVEERHGMIWIWMGEATPEPDRIPDFSFQDPDENYAGKRYLRVGVRYELEIENILDLSHIEFLHPTTLGSSSISKGEYSCVEADGFVWSKRDVHGEIVAPRMAAMLGISDDAVTDRWIYVRWSAPANLALFAGVVATGRPQSEGHNLTLGHFFTPETNASTHYWYTVCFPKALGSAFEAIAEEQADFHLPPFEEEDLPMLEAQQRNIGNADLESLKWAWLPGDAAGARARLALKRAIESEAAAELPLSV